MTAMLHKIKTSYEARNNLRHHLVDTSDLHANASVRIISECSNMLVYSL